MQDAWDGTDLQLASWVAELPDDMHEKLADTGLIEPRRPRPTAPSLSKWLETCIGQRGTVLKPASIRSLELTAKRLKEFFGEAHAIDAITVSTSKEWRAWLFNPPKAKDSPAAAHEGEKTEPGATQKSKKERKAPSEATVRLHCRNAKTIFGEAVECELIAENPFRRLASRAVAAAQGGMSHRKKLT